MTEYRKKRGNKHGLNGINIFAYELLFFLVSPQASSSFPRPWIRWKQTNKQQNKARRTEGHSENTELIRKLGLHICIPPWSYSSLPHSAESALYPDDCKPQQGIHWMEKRCQEVHWRQKSEFWERKFPGLLPWGPEQKCRAIKGPLRLVSRSGNSANMWKDVTLLSQVPSVWVTDWPQQAIFGVLLGKHHIALCGCDNS